MDTALATSSHSNSFISLEDTDISTSSPTETSANPSTTFFQGQPLPSFKIYNPLLQNMLLQTNVKFGFGTPKMPGRIMLLRSTIFAGDAPEAKNHQRRLSIRRVLLRNPPFKSYDALEKLSREQWKITYTIMIMLLKSLSGGH